MALAINTNVASLSAQNSMNKAQMEQNTAMERLTTGKRINTAADDAAGLAIANKMTSQVKGLNQAVRNANDGISMLQTAAGGLEESGNILQRMRELAVQSATGTYDDDSNRGAMQAEVEQLKAELDRIAETTTFNGLNILDGSQAGVELQVGANANEVIKFDIGSTKADDLGGVNDDITGADAGSATALLTALQNADGGANSITVNGQNVGDLSGTASLEDAIDAINDNTVGFTAGVTSELATTSAGDGVITSSQKVTFEVTSLDGSVTSFDVSGTANLEEVVDSVNSQSEGALKASIVDGKMVLNADGAQGISVSSDTGVSLSTALGVDSTGTRGVGSAGIALTAAPAATAIGNLDLNITLADGSTSTINNAAAATWVIGDAAANATAMNTAFAGSGYSFSVDDNGRLNLSAPAGVEVTGFTLTDGTTAATNTSINNLFGLGSGTEQFSSSGPSLTLNAEDGTDGLTISYSGTLDTAAVSQAIGIDERTAEGVVEGSAATSSVQVGDTAQTETVLREGDLKINGIDIGEITEATVDLDGNVADGTADATEIATANAATAQNVVDAINEKKADTGVVASLNATNEVVLTSTDGKEISIQYADSASATNVLNVTGLQETNASEGAVGSVSNIDVSTAAGAQKALDVLDTAIEQVSKIQGELGAVENRLDFTVSNLSNVSENAAAARSRIQDADFAAESANLSRAQVLQQASQAMLAQANSAPKQVMSLLQ